MTEPRGQSTPDLGVIVPVYNEEAALPLFWERLERTLAQMPVDGTHVMFVDDGSSDGSVVWLRDLAERNPQVELLELSRNFGKESAMTAGLDFCPGRRVLIIDADLQDPPELLPQMWALAEQGFDVVVPRRTGRPGESRAKIFFSAAFYWMMQRIHAGVDLTPGTGDFRLLSRRAVDAIAALREKNRFMKGIFEWVGYPRAVLDYEREPRARGATKFNFFKLLHLAADGVAAFSTAPLKIATLAGLGAALAAFLYGCYIIIKTMVYGDPVPGFPTLVTVTLFFSGVQLLSIGILGEYIGRIYNEAKGRPLYVVKNRAVAAEQAPPARTPAPAHPAARARATTAAHD